MLYSRLSFLSLILLLAAYVSALPIFEDLQARVDPETSTNKKDWPSKGQLKKMLKTEPNEATFWSGRRGSTSTQVAAEEHAAANGGKTLEMKLQEGGAKMPPWTPGDKKVEKKWTQAAKVFANKAQGDVNAHIGTTVRPDSVYTKTEKPALLKNKKVSSITEHMADGTSTVIPGKKKRT